MTLDVVFVAGLLDVLMLKLVAVAVEVDVASAAST